MLLWLQAAERNITCYTGSARYCNVALFHFLAILAGCFSKHPWTRECKASSSAILGHACTVLRRQNGTVAQVYVAGEFIGGADILWKMHEDGELAKALQPGTGAAKSTG